MEIHLTGWPAILVITLTVGIFAYGFATLVSEFVSWLLRKFNIYNKDL